MGLLIKLQNGDTQLKSLKFGKDRPGGGDSGQPYIQKPISEPGQLAQADSDFLLRGGIKAPLDAAADVSRLSKYFTNLKSPEGLLFTAKQNVLSLTAPKTEASDKVNGGIYTPLSTLAQAGVGFIGGHLNKQGLDPTGTSPTFSIKDYGPVVYKKNQDGENRLVGILDTTITQYTDTPNILSYKGGPGSTLGIGNTNIKFATDANGAPVRTGLNGTYNANFPFTRPEVNYNLESIFTGKGLKPSLSVLYAEKNNLTIDALLGNRYFELFNNRPFLRTDLQTVDNPFAPMGVTEQRKTEVRDTVIGFYKSEINNKLVNFGRQLVVDSQYQTDSGYFEALSPLLPNKPLGRYSSELTLITDPQHVGTEDLPKSTALNSSETKGYLANLNKNSGDYVENNELITYHNPYRVGGRGISYDFRKTLRSKRGFKDVANPKYPQYDRILPEEVPDYSQVTTIDNIYYNSSDKRTSNNIEQGLGLIDFKISIVNPTAPDPSNEKTLNFRAYIDSLSDSYNADWASQNYMGRAESFYKYNAFSRDISLGFTVVADSKDNLAGMYNQLNILASSIAPTYTDFGYMAGNLHRITMGDYINAQYGVVTGFTYEIMDESPWEVDRNEQLPYYIQVTGFNFKVVHNFRPEMKWDNNYHQFINQ
jgi:hypothetical protein